VPVSVTPSSGNTSNVTFQAVVSDGSGYADISRIELLIVVPGSGSNYCDLIYQRTDNRFWIVNDAGTQWVGPVGLGSGGTLSNSQCSLNAAAATVAGNGANLTVTFPVTFTSAFAGNKNVYLYGISLSGQGSAYQPLGTWNVPGAIATPAPVSVTPPAGNTSTGVIQAVISDGSGYQDISRIELLINAPGNSRNYCDLIYQRAENRFWIVNDAATQWIGPVALGSGGTLSNSQCTLNASAATVTANGTSLTVTFPVTFSSTFAGAKTVYLYGASNSGQNSNYQPLGTWTVPGQ
jgi:hypothetical protein